MTEQVEGCNERLSLLERRLASERQELTLIKDEVNKLKKSPRRADAVPLIYEMRLGEVEERLQQLEQAVENVNWTEERMASVHASLLATVHSDLKEEIMDEIDNQLTVKKQNKTPFQMQQRAHDTTAMASGRQVWSTLSKPPLPKDDFTTPQQMKPIPKPRLTAPSTNRSISTASPKSMQRRPLQKPMPYDGSTTWEAYFVQFEIIAEVNGWDEHEKTAFLASSLKGKALSVLGNMRTEDRHDFSALVKALSNRFGSAHQTDLSRVRFKNRLKQRDESLPELAKDIERLAKLSYPEAPSSLQDALARDQFVDALPDEEIRLKLRQEKPKSLQDTLTLALELESFQLASRQQRGRFVREAKLESSDELIVKEEKKTADASTPLERIEKSNAVLVEAVTSLEKSLRCLQGLAIKEHGEKRRRRSSGCWNCEETGHIRKNCPLLQQGGQRRTTSNATSSSSQGNGK